MLVYSINMKYVARDVDTPTHHSLENPSRHLLFLHNPEVLVCVDFVEVLL
jgi:hypothetical protein